MKKYLFILLFLSMSAYAKCYKLPCHTQIQSAKSNAINLVKEAYEKNNEALNNLEQAYSSYNDSLNKQNELLEKIKKIKAESFAEEAEVVYLLKKHNQLKSKNIDIKNSKEF